MTSKEHKEATGKSINVQEVKKPHCLHCSKVQELWCRATRLHRNTLLLDIMRFFHDDSPSRSCQCGYQNGGHYLLFWLWSTCRKSSWIGLVLLLRHVSLKDRQDLVFQGPIGKRNPPLQQQKPFSAMKEEELDQELSGGGIYEVKKRNSYKTFSMKVCMLWSPYMRTDAWHFTPHWESLYRATIPYWGRNLKD